MRKTIILLLALMSFFSFSKNYYRVTPIYNIGGTVVTGKNYIDIAF